MYHPVLFKRVDKYPMALLFQQNLSKYELVYKYPNTSGETDICSNDACAMQTTFVIYLQLL